MVARYRRRPAIVEAIQWLGNNLDEVECFMHGKCLYVQGNGNLFIDTRMGEERVYLTNYITKNVADDYSVCDAQTFNERYELWK